MRNASTMDVIRILKRIMQANGVKQLVIVDDGCEVPRLHINRDDFEADKDSFICVFPGPWISGADVTEGSDGDG